MLATSNGGDKSSRNRESLRLLGITADAEEFSIYGREMKCFFIRFSRGYFPCTQCFFGVPAWGWYHYPLAALSVSEQPGAGFISAEKTAFSEWVLCADGHAVPSCTQRFFGVPAWGWYHYPRRAFHAVETLDARGSRRRICRFYAVPEFALCGLNIPAVGTHATPAPNRAHSGSHGETRRVLRVDGDDVSGNGIIDTIGPFQADQTVAVALAEGHRNAVSP